MGVCAQQTVRVSDLDLSAMWQEYGTFTTFRVYEMPFDSYDRERKGLFTRRMYRTIAPWTTENPIFMHLTSTDPATVRRAVDQCAVTGYEMIILSFGSGLNAEDISDANIAKYKDFVDYARSKGIEMGCYSLLASRWISDEVDVINPATGKRGGMTFGSSPCLCSDIIHLRRPDANDWDGIMHVDPQGSEKALAMFYNPTDRDITRRISLPLYYTGLTDTASIRREEGEAVSHELGRDYTVELDVTIPARGYTWYVVE